MNNKELATADDLAMCPAMAALPSNRQRNFIRLLFEIDARGDVLTPAAAARAAGYSPNGNPHQISSAASKLLADARIQAALQAEARLRMHSLAPKAWQHLQTIMGDRTHKDQYKAVAAILNVWTRSN